MYIYGSFHCNLKNMGLEMRKCLALTILLTLLWKEQGQPSLAQIVVAQDGSGNFRTINDAIEAAPNNSLQKYFIHIKNGIYKENIIIGKEKTNIVLVGEGMKNTIISEQRSVGSGFNTWDTSTVKISGEGFMAQGLTFENTAGPQMQQAVAVGIEAEHSIFYKCRFRGFQDTLFAYSGSQFFRDCQILGTIDFICGNSKVVFQNCVIAARKPLDGQYIVLTAQQREHETEGTGIVLQNCIIAATGALRREQTKYKYFLGRPWGTLSRVVIMQSLIDYVIDKEGWKQWEQKPIGSPYFAEYNNRGPGANTLGRVNWSRVITSPTEASYFTVRNFIQGDTWIPSSVPYKHDLL